MNLHDITIPQSSDRLSISRWAALLTLAANGGGELAWDRDGEVRIVSNATLVNALALHHDYQKQLECGRIDEVPLAARFLFWWAATPRLPHVNLRLDPSPR